MSLKSKNLPWRTQTLPTGQREAKSCGLMWPFSLTSSCGSRNPTERYRGKGSFWKNPLKSTQDFQDCALSKYISKNLRTIRAGGKKYKKKKVIGLEENNLKHKWRIQREPHLFPLSRCLRINNTSLVRSNCRFVCDSTSFSLQFVYK